MISGGLLLGGLIFIMLGTTIMVLTNTRKSPLRKQIFFLFGFVVFLGGVFLLFDGYAFFTQGEPAPPEALSHLQIYEVVYQEQTNAGWLTLTKIGQGKQPRLFLLKDKPPLGQAKAVERDGIKKLVPLLGEEEKNKKEEQP